MNLGDRIFLPISVKEFPSEKEKQKQEKSCNEEEANFIQSLVLYKVILKTIFILKSLFQCQIYDPTRVLEIRIHPLLSSINLLEWQFR